MVIKQVSKNRFDFGCLVPLISSQAGKNCFERVNTGSQMAQTLIRTFLDRGQPTASDETFAASVVGDHLATFVQSSGIDSLRMSCFSLLPIVSKTFSKTGKLLDISPRGLAVVVDRKIEKDVHVNVGFFLGKRKVTSKAVVKNSSNFDNGFRVGIEFVELKENHVSYITELNASKAHGH